MDVFLLPWAGRPGAGGQAAAMGTLPAYITPQGRDLRVDLLRGFFVFAMIVDHVRGASLLQLLTGGNRFFTSAAEGFILTSGLMAGLIYQRIVVRDGIVAASSPSLYPDDNNLKFLGLGAEFASKDPLALATTAPGLSSLRIWLDVGQTDPWVEPATALHATLQARGITNTWNLNPGGHNGAYWALHVPDYLRFYADAFAGR